ncbi:hypothetical protein BHE74_00011907 [Ensete ventricosum]|nr:hypothetical protein GW17_00033892 [Ensete ventricosum]RWW79788.1 hypothetical protein BHE74_00011907 [Ensete ventricosum]RZS21585.1 hypothetical protein BHM03_00054239 [Ensete ventricosum]
MDVAHLLGSWVSSPVLSPSPRPFGLPGLRIQRRRAPFGATRRLNQCLACGADTLVAGSEGSSHALRGEKAAEAGDLIKSWLHHECLWVFVIVVCWLLSFSLFLGGEIRFSWQAGDVAFRVPNSLVVTLDRVLGNETIGKSARECISKYRRSSIPRKENGSSKKREVGCPSFSCKKSLNLLSLLFQSSINCLFFQVYVGREKEAISEMLPYLRLGYISDTAEMNSVISSQGPTCPVCPFNSHFN